MSFIDFVKKASNRLQDLIKSTQEYIEKQSQIRKIIKERDSKLLMVKRKFLAKLSENDLRAIYLYYKNKIEETENYHF